MSAKIAPNSRTNPVRFIDLFAGIGGIRIAVEEAASRSNLATDCVFSSEIDLVAQRTYREFFGHEEIAGDITKVEPSELPEFDLLAGGFPCQPFSLAGVSKKESMGRGHGFNDEAQGTLFFNVAEILRVKQPKAFLLENVRNLLSHDKGRTIQVISRALTEVGYSFTWKVLSAESVVPQLRKRIFIVGIRADLSKLKPGFYDAHAFWDGVNEAMAHESLRYKTLQLGLAEDAEWPSLGAILDDEAEIDPGFGISQHLWEYHQKYKEKHKERGNGFGFGLVTRESKYARTLSARYYKDGAEILVSRGESMPPRKLTPKECARLQGFPAHYAEKFEKPYKGPTSFGVSTSSAYKQLGNSVPVPVVTAVLSQLLPLVKNPKSTPKLFRTPLVSEG